MKKSISKSINEKFDKQIEHLLDSINKPIDSDTYSDGDSSEFVSETIRSTKSPDGSETTITEDNYQAVNLVRDLKSVIDAKNEYNQQKSDKTMTILKTGASVISVALVLGFEISHTITSRSLGFIPKIKL